MKVKVEVTLDVDAEAWASEFGTAPEDVRADVKTYFQGTCTEQLEVLGLKEEN